MVAIGDFGFHIRQKLGQARRAVFPVPVKLNSHVRLHLGCGGIDHPGFTNVDGIARPHVHHVRAIDRLPCFKDNTFELVYFSHTLEHFPRAQTPRVLKEWRRVLAPGGKLALSVPDFDRILQLYHLQDKDVIRILPPLFGGQDYPFNFHHTAFTARSLTQELVAAGFREVRHWVPGCDEWHTLPDWSGRSIMVCDVAIPISLNLEATK